MEHRATSLPVKSTRWTAYIVVNFLAGERLLLEASRHQVRVSDSSLPGRYLKLTYESWNLRNRSCSLRGPWRLRWPSYNHRLRRDQHDPSSNQPRRSWPIHSHGGRHVWWHWCSCFQESRGHTECARSCSGNLNHHHHWFPSQDANACWHDLLRYCWCSNKCVCCEAAKCYSRRYVYLTILLLSAILTDLRSIRWSYRFHSINRC